MLVRGLLAGTTSGLVLGLFFKIIELTSHIPIYTLLLAIDFIPFLDQLQLGETFEFSLHMFLSLLIGIIYSLVMSITNRNKPYLVAIFLTLPTFFLYFLLTTISDKTSLLPTDMIAFSVWVIGHLLYAVTLASSYTLFKKIKGNLNQL